MPAHAHAGAHGRGTLPPAFWALWVGILVNRFATFAVALLPSWLVGERGLGPDVAGRLAAVFGVGLTAAGLLGGVLADRLGRRATMVGGLTAGAATVLALTVARSLPALAALTFLAGAAGETYRPAMSAAVVDLVPPAARSRAFGLVYWGVNVAGAAGMLAAAAIARVSLRALFVADAATSLLFAAWLLGRVPETRPAAHGSGWRAAGFSPVLRDTTFLVFLGLQLATLLVFVQWQLGLQLDMRAHGLGPGDYALVVATNCGLVVVLQPLLGPRLRRLDETHLLMAMAALAGAGFGLYAVVDTLAGYVAGSLLWTLGEIVGIPTAFALVARFSPASLRGRYQGAYSMVWGVSLTLGPLAAGEVFARAGGRALWLGCAGISALVVVGQAAAAGARRRRLRHTVEGVPGEETPAGAAGPWPACAGPAREGRGERHRPS